MSSGASPAASAARVPVTDGVVFSETKVLGELLQEVHGASPSPGATPAGERSEAIRSRQVRSVQASQKSKSGRNRWARGGAATRTPETDFTGAIRALSPSEIPISPGTRRAKSVRCPVTGQPQ